MSIKVEKERCPQNHPCPLVRICPHGAITQKSFNAPEINEALCAECGLCVNSCAYQAVQFSKQPE